MAQQSQPLTGGGPAGIPARARKQRDPAHALPRRGVPGHLHLAGHRPGTARRGDHLHHQRRPGVAGQRHLGAAQPALRHPHAGRRHRSSSPSSACSSPPRWAWVLPSTSPSTPALGLRGWLKPILEVLAAIPSVVLGFFALTVLSPTIIDPVCPGPRSPSTCSSAGVAVGVLITPLVASDRRGRAVRRAQCSLREASYGLGRAQAHDDVCGSSCRPPSRASWRRSSSASPGPSARR